MNMIAYKCPLCGKDGRAEYDPEGVNQLEHWKKLLHCNRCADFMVELRSLRERARQISMAHMTLQKTGKLTEERRSELRSKLSEATKAIAGLVGHQWSIVPVWEPEFIDQLLEFPDKSEFIVNQYARMIKDAAAQTHAQARLAI